MKSQLHLDADTREFYRQALRDADEHIAERWGPNALRLLIIETAKATRTSKPDDAAYPELVFFVAAMAGFAWLAEQDDQIKPGISDTGSS